MKINKKDLDQYIIKQYQQDEKTMVLIFAQWCINNNLDPYVLYKEAYPKQIENELLEEAMNQTVPKEAAEHIFHDIVVQVLQFFGNDDLAFVVQSTAEKLKKNK